jgi:hypothetical protein
MVSLNMIDTQGGIKRMFQAQRRRFFPLPDYDLSQPERVMVTLRGRILDVRYTRPLMAQGELDLVTIMLLDKLPEVLTQEQKLNRVHNLLRQLADSLTFTLSSTRGSAWCCSRCTLHLHAFFQLPFVQI